MKKIKRINQLKNDKIMNVNYVVIDLVTYNDMLYKSIRAESAWNRVHNLQEKLQQERLDSTKEINKLRKKD